MRFAVISGAAILLCSATFANAQVANPSHTCVQNCGSATVTSATPADTEAARKERDRRRAREAELTIDEGVLYYDRKDWPNAIRSFEEALEFDPDDTYVQKWLKAAKAAKAQKDFGPIVKDGKVRTPPPAPAPPLRRGGKQGPVGGSGTADAVSIGGKG